MRKKDRFIIKVSDLIEKLFYVSYSIQVILTYVLGYSTLVYSSNRIIHILQSALKYTSLGLILIALIIDFNFNRYKQNSFIKIITFFLIVFISAYRSGSSTLLYAFLFIVVASNLNLIKFLRYDIFLKIINILFVIILCVLNIIPNYTYFKSGYIVQSLGFTHPNFLGIIVAYLVLEIIFYKNNQLTPIYYFVIIFVLMIIYRTTGSITGGIMIVSALFLSIFSRYYKKIIFNLAKYSFPICCSIFFFFTFYHTRYYDFIVTKLGKNMMSRFIYAWNGILDYGLSIFGQKVTLINNELAQEKGLTAFVLDSSYIRLGIIYGVIILILIGFYYFKIAKYGKDKNLIGLSIALIAILIGGISESHMLIFQINFTLILFGQLIQKRRKMF